MKYGILHNDLKCDNIFLDSLTSAIIIDYGKACGVKEGKYYKLSECEKEQYARRYSHIAPDVRDGIFRQSVSSDIYSLGRIIQVIIKNSTLNNGAIEQLSVGCMQYHMHFRPNMTDINETMKRCT